MDALPENRSSFSCEPNPHLKALLDKRLRLDADPLPANGHDCESALSPEVPHHRVDETGPHKETCAQRAWRLYKLMFVSVSLILAIFDLGADWWAVKDFFLYDGGNLTIALTFFVSCSSILFFMEVYNGVLSIRVYGFGKGNRDKVELWREALSFGLLLLEDLPVTLIMYSAFRGDNCALYERIFEQSKVARTALLAAFISAIWKGVLSLKYCLQFICKENYTPWNEAEAAAGRRRRSSLPPPSMQRPQRHRHRPSRQVSLSWEDRMFCCACVRCRPLRILINTLVCIFTAYVFLTFVSDNNIEKQPECFTKTPIDEIPAMSERTGLMLTPGYR